MAARPLIAGVICLVVLGAGGAIYLFRDRLLQSGSSLLIADSGTEAERPPPRPPAPSAPSEQAPSGSLESATAKSSGPSGPRPPSLAEAVESASKPTQQSPTATGAGVISASETPPPPQIDAGAKQAAEILARDRMPPSAESAESPAGAQSPAVARPASAPVAPVADSAAEDHAPPPAKVAENAAKDEGAPPPNVGTRPMAVATPSAESPAGARAEMPASDEKQPASPVVKPETGPNAESSAKVAERITAAATATIPGPANAQAKPIAEGAPQVEAKATATPLVEPPAASQPGLVSEAAAKIEMQTVPALPKPVAEIKTNEETAPAMKVAESATAAVTSSAEAPASSQAGPLAETPAKIDTQRVPSKAPPVAEPPTKVETPAQAAATAAPSVEPPAGSRTGPVSETPAKTQMPAAAPPDNPVADGSEKDGMAPSASVTPKPTATATTPDESPAGSRMGAVSEAPAKAETPEVPPPAGPAAESSAKEETAAPAPPVSSREASRPETSGQAASPPVNSLTENPMKDETAAPAKVAEGPPRVETAPVQPPSNPGAAPVAESSPQVETPATGQESKPIVAGAAPALLPPPANGDAKPREPAPTPGADASNAPDEGGAGASAGRLAAIVPLLAPQAMLAIDDATVGKDYAADLPPFSDPSGEKGISLHVEPRPPEGLSFIDLGAGFGEISGRPTKPGQFVFDVVASNNLGGAARMTAKINVAPAPLESKPQPAKSDANAQVAALEPEDKTARFLRGFDGGPCFLARAGAATGASITIEGVGAEKQVFQRFYASFLRDVGVEPTLNVRLIASPQCPVVGLIAAAQSDRAAAPTIKLAAYDVPRGKPLAGVIGALAGRSFDLLLITNDGFAHKIASRGLASDQIAPFSVPITPDAGSIGALQILVAIASSKPLDALAAFRSGPAADILPKVAAQLGPTDAALNVEYVKFLK